MELCGKLQGTVSASIMHYPSQWVNPNRQDCGGKQGAIRVVNLRGHGATNQSNKGANQIGSYSPFFFVSHSSFPFFLSSAFMACARGGIPGSVHSCEVQVVAK